MSSESAENIEGLRSEVGGKLESIQNLLGMMSGQLQSWDTEQLTVTRESLGRIDSELEEFVKQLPKRESK